MARGSEPRPILPTMPAAPIADRLTDAATTGTLNETKGCTVSENQAPSPRDEASFTPPPPPPPVEPTATPALPAYPVEPAPQPIQSYPGAAPTYPAATPPSPGAGPSAYGAQPAAAPQPGYAPPPAQPAYAVAPMQPGPQQPGYAPYGAQGYPAVAQRPTSGLAITSLVCGIAGVALFWAIIPLLASIAAVITGHMALGQTKRDPSIGGRGLAITGLILGYAVVGIGAFVLISTIISFLFLGAFTLPFVFSS